LVNERATVHPECTRTLKRYNFFLDITRDFMRCPKCYASIYPDSASGRFDVIAGYPVARGEVYWSGIEVKYGGLTSLPFSRVSDNQRSWYESHYEEYNGMWLWFCTGKRINDDKYPRRTWLIPFKLFLSLEENLSRKSIPSDCEKLEPYELLWEGDGFWSIPTNHALWRNALSE